MRGMQTAELFQRRIIERLHAERNAIDACRAKTAKAGCFHAGGICLERHFDVAAIAQCLPMQSRIVCTEDGCISDGVPPPKKMLDTVRSGHASRCRRNLGLIGTQEPRFIDAAMTDMAVEVAIGALRQAERPVDVDGEGGG